MLPIWKDDSSFRENVKDSAACILLTPCFGEFFLTQEIFRFTSFLRICLFDEFDFPSNLHLSKTSPGQVLFNRWTSSHEVSCDSLRVIRPKMPILSTNCL